MGADDAMRRGTGAVAPSSARRREPRRTAPTVVFAACSAGALTTLGHLLYGSLSAEASLLIGLGWAALAAVLTQAVQLPGAAWSRLAWPGVPFLLAIVVVFITTLGARPAWSSPVCAWLADGVASLDRSATRLEVSRLLGLGCAALAGVALGVSGRSARLTLSVLVIAGAAFAAAALVAYVGRLIPQTQDRLEAWFLNPNCAGTVFGLLFCLSLYLGGWEARGRSPFERRDWLWLVCGALLLSALLATRSRAALISTVLAAAVFYGLRIAGGRAEPKRVLQLAGIGAVAVVVGVFMQASVAARFTGVSQDADLRQAILLVHWRHFLTRPLFGFGLGAFDAMNRLHLDGRSFSTLWNIRAAENVYVQWLVEGGLAATAPMFGAILAVLASTARVVLEPTRRQGLVSVFFACDGLVLVHGLFDFSLQIPSISLLWALILGLQTGLALPGASPRSRMNDHAA